MSKLIEILRETVRFYNSSNRAEEYGSCKYLADNGNMCAVGRCLTSEGLEYFKDIQGTVEVLAGDGYLVDGIDKYMQPQYVGLDLDEWDKIQTIHDTEYNWTETGYNPIVMKDNLAYLFTPEIAEEVLKD